MKQLNLWNYLGFGAMILSILTFILLLLSEHSYSLMRLFFAIALPVATSLILLALIAAITSVLTAILEFRCRRKTTRAIMLWLSVLTLSIFSFFGAFMTKYEITASANFDNQKYDLIKFLYIDAYSYKLYSCEPLGLFCRRSSGYIGIPYQNDPISLQYDWKRRKVYIKNADQIIHVPD